MTRTRGRMRTSETLPSHRRDLRGSSLGNGSVGGNSHGKSTRASRRSCPCQSCQPPQAHVSLRCSLSSQLPSPRDVPGLAHTQSFLYLNFFNIMSGCYFRNFIHKYIIIYLRSIFANFLRNICNAFTLISAFFHLLNSNSDNVPTDCKIKILNN